jgi:hypothetical protein
VSGTLIVVLSGKAIWEAEQGIKLNGLYWKLSSLCGLESGLQFSSFFSFTYLLLRDHIQDKIHASPITKHVVSNGRESMACKSME